MHIKWSIYQDLILYKENLANQVIPSDCGHGWQMEAGQLEIQLTEGVKPQELIEVLLNDEGDP